MKVKIVNLNDRPLPEYKTDGSAGMDLICDLEKQHLIEPGDRIKVPTGIKIKLPTGYEAQIRPRSGLALKEGITTINAPGTIDSDYIGEVNVILINLGQKPFMLMPGMRIAQMVVAKYDKVEWDQVSILGPTKRGDKGFGSTGVD